MSRSGREFAPDMESSKVPSGSGDVCERSSVRPNLTKAVHASLDVDTDQALRASDLLRAEASRLREVVLSLSNDGFQPCGGDPASVAAASAFNHKARALIDSYRGHIEKLGSQAEELAAAAL